MARKPQKSKKGNARARRDRIARKCKKYRDQARRERNKLRRLARHWNRQPGDRPAVMSCVDKILDEHWALAKAWTDLVGKDWRGKARQRP